MLTDINIMTGIMKLFHTQKFKQKYLKTNNFLRRHKNGGKKMDEDFQEILDDEDEFLGEIEAMDLDN